MKSPIGADEFGDFQTPPSLAKQACQLLAVQGLAPASVIEPTCGIGNFVLASLDTFAQARVVGVEINAAHVEKLTASLARHAAKARAEVIQGNFFDFDWSALLGRLAEPVLVVGNPPWVTNSQLGALGSQNLPQKTNFQKHVGLDALTGKSNFDISEWMLIRLLELLRDWQATLVMLCKTAVARKALVHAWKSGIGVQAAEMALNRRRQFLWCSR